MKPSEMLKLWESVESVKTEANLRNATNSTFNCEHCRHWQPSSGKCMVLSQMANSLITTRKDQVCSYFKRK